MHIVNISDFVFPEEFNSMEVLDVSVDGLFGMVDFCSDFRSQIAFQIERDNFFLMSYCSAEIMVISPSWQNTAGLPIGMQAIGPAWQESLLLRIAYFAEQFIDRKKPAIHYSFISK